MRQILKNFKTLSQLGKKPIEKEIPSAVKCLQNSLESYLAFFKFPEEEWISLRTTNIFERLNKEFKRRAKPIGKGLNKDTIPAFVKGKYLIQKT